MAQNLTPEQLEKRRQTNSKILKFGCLPIFGLLVLIFVISLFSNDEKASTDIQNVITTKPTTQKAPENWQYSDDVDKMGKTTKLAVNESSQKEEFGFPYQGGSTSKIYVQKMGNKTDVIFEIEPGQIMSNENARLKFDEKAPYTVSLQEPQDMKSNVVFLGSSAKILSDLKKSKKLIIEIPFYQEGARQIEFNVEGLKW